MSPSRKRWWVVVPIVGLVAGITTLHLWQRFFVPRDAVVVGVSLDTAWHSRIGITRSTYDAALSRVGARIFDIRPGGESASEILDRIDALLLSGGGDVDPALYGGEREAAKLVDRARDDLEIALIRGARDRGMPVLGICRGIQILNVAMGGTVRSIRGEPALDSVHGIDLTSLSAHPVAVEPGSNLARLIGTGSYPVNSFHGQIVDRVGSGLTVCARAPDGIVEGIEIPGDRLFVGIQWHPEVQSLADPEKLALFDELCRQARAYRATRRPK